MPSRVSDRAPDGPAGGIYGRPVRAPVMLPSTPGLASPSRPAARTVDPLRRAEEEPMDRMIAVIDLTTGEIIDRSSTTLTLDLLSHGHYLATDGKQREYSVFPRPLSWRARGEDCLVADRRGRASSSIAGIYRLRAVEWE